MLADNDTGTVFFASADTARSVPDSQRTEAVPLEQTASTHLIQH